MESNKEKVQKLALKYSKDHPDLSGKEIAEMLQEEISGISFRTLWDYCKPSSLAEYEESLNGSKESPSEDHEDPEETNREINRDWYYNETTDTYLVYLSHVRRPLMFSGKDIRDMKAAYSRMSPGGYDTIGEICRTFKISKKNFEGVKKAMGWSHSDDPYTDEEHYEKDPVELAEDLLQKKKEQFDRVFRKKEWKLIEKDSSNWRELLYVCGNKDLSVSELKKHIDIVTSVPEFLKDSKVIYSTLDSKYEIKTPYTEKDTLIIPVSDVHYGKRFVSDNPRYKDYNKFVADVRLQQIMSIISSKKQDLSHIKNIVYLSLGDNFESLFGNMRNGQYLTMDILGRDQWVKVVQFHSTLINHIRQTFPDSEMTMQFIPGNHDRVFADKSFNSEEVINAILADRISVEFKNDQKMKWVVGEKVVSVMLPNNVNLISHHGHVVKVPDTNVQINNVITLYGSKKASRYIVAQGHLHEFKYRSGSNFKYFINPSICGSDEYTIYDLKLESPAEFCMIHSTEDDDLILGPYTLK